VRVVFFGTPEPAAVALRALLASSHEVAAVVTQPDRPRGRSGTPQPPPAKVVATEAGLTVRQPSSPRDDGFAEALGALAPDACAVVAYGHIIPANVLAVPRKGFVNVHYSLLPRYRGAAPVQRAIMAGEIETGVSVFVLEPTLDTGPVLHVVREPIRPDDTAGTLMERLAEIGARALVESLDGLEGGVLESRTQDSSEASSAPKIKPEEGEIDWRLPASRIVNLVRALNPAPGAYTTLDGKRLKIWLARQAERAHGASAGTVVPLEKGRLGIAAADGVVELLEVQLEGSKRLDAGAFIRGHRLEEGKLLGSAT
jgi:methionyl-tRNA formyltransferase